MRTQSKLQLPQRTWEPPGCESIIFKCSHNVLGINEDDERKEEDEKLVLMLQIDIPHVESHTQLTGRCKQRIELHSTHERKLQPLQTIKVLLFMF